MTSWFPIVTIDAGPGLRFSTEELLIGWSAESKAVRYAGGATFSNLPSRGQDGDTVTLTLPASMLDIADLLSRGIFLPGAEVELAMHRRGEDYVRREIWMVGQVLPNGIRRYLDKTEIEIGPFENRYDPPFPPAFFTEADFPNMPENFQGQSMNVLRGPCKDVPLVPLRKTEPNATYDVDFVIAGEPVGQQRVRVRPNGNDEDNYAFWAEVKQRNGAGAVYSYVSVTAAQLAAAGTGAYVADCDGRRIQDNMGGFGSLGDMVVDLLQSYGRFPKQRIDHARLARFRTRANRINAAMIFGGQPGQTLVQSLKGRLEGQFPIRISWDGGRIGADFLGYEDYRIPGRIFNTVQDRMWRLDPVEIVPDQPYTSFSVAYDQSGTSGLWRGRLSADASNDARCARATSRFGTIVYPTVECPDVVTSAGARAVLDGLVDQHALLRWAVRYLMPMDLARDLILFERYDITDSDLSWTEQRFRLEGLSPQQGSDYVEARFVGLDEIS